MHPGSLRLILGLTRISHAYAPPRLTRRCGPLYPISKTDQGRIWQTRRSATTWEVGLFLRRGVLAQLSSCQPGRGATRQGDSQPWRCIGRGWTGAGSRHRGRGRRRCIGGRGRFWFLSRSLRDAIAVRANESRAAVGVHATAQGAIAGALGRCLTERPHSQHAARGASGKDLEHITPGAPSRQPFGQRIEPLVIHYIGSPCTRSLRNASCRHAERQNVPNHCRSRL